jgi:DNA-binding MarR family transcriptional regulator
MSYEQLKLKNQLCHRLYMASNSIVRTYRQPLTELNLTYPQYVVMMALWEEGKISIAELIEKTAIDGSAMTQILKKMTEKSLLTVIKDEDDKRKRFIRLTQAGEKLQSTAAGIPEKIRCKVTSLNPSQSQQLMQLLDLLIDNLHKVD